MPTRTLTIAYQQLSSAELDPGAKALVAAAKRAADLAYAPYSDFHVGAAARLDNAEFVQAANLENAAYPQCLCAEATLLGAVHTQYAGRSIEALAVVARRGGGPWVQAAPCGSCRQQLLEAEHRQGSALSVLLADAEGGALVFGSVADLLPLGFRFATS